MKNKVTKHAIVLSVIYFNIHYDENRQSTRLLNKHFEPQVLRDECDAQQWRGTAMPVCVWRGVDTVDKETAVLYHTRTAHGGPVDSLFCTSYRSSHKQTFCPQMLQ